ncbi:MAG TPA: hypothetical protein VLH60_03685, partial [Sedimentisphaerales bacterium]|nr:hypothetical protein [Sedimentisphaerales bacterium]
NMSFLTPPSLQTRPPMGPSGSSFSGTQDTSAPRIKDPEPHISSGWFSIHGAQDMHVSDKIVIAYLIVPPYLNVLLSEARMATV